MLDLLYLQLISTYNVSASVTTVVFYKLITIIIIIIITTNVVCLS